MSSYSIRVTLDAEDDIERIGEYIAEADSPERAGYVVRTIRRIIAGLSEFPERGSLVKEMLDAGERDYRQIHFKPYRIIYQVIEDTVTVQLIADGRRDMRTLFLRRLLRA